MHKIGRWRYGATAVMAAILLPAAATSHPPDVTTLRRASLAATCNACHGAATRPAVVADLNTMPGDRIRESMLAFKQGAREGTVMPQLAKGYSDAQIAQLAAFYGSHAEATTR